MKEDLYAQGRVFAQDASHDDMWKIDEAIFLVLKFVQGKDPSYIKILLIKNRYVTKTTYLLYYILNRYFNLMHSSPLILNTF